MKKWDTIFPETVVESKKATGLRGQRPGTDRRNEG